jgi:putative PEP-CTERM system TPR-repeat lipoprotein
MLLVTSLLFLTACAEHNSPQALLLAGKSAKADGRYSEAIVLYKNALQQDITLIEARFELGALYSQLGNLPAAESFLLAAVEQQFALEQAVPLLAGVYLQQNDLLALEKFLDKFLDKSLETKPLEETLNDLPLALSPTLKRQLSLYRVLWLARSGELELAKSSWESLTDKPLSCEMCLFTQAQLQSYQTPAEALATLDTLLAKYPANALGYLLRGQLYFALRNPLKAYDNFQQFQDLQPSTGYAQFLLAISAMQMEDTPAATMHVDALLSAFPRQPLANHLKALLVFAKGEHEDAKRFAETSISSGLKAPANYLVAGVSAYHMDNLETAYGHLRKAVMFYPDNGELNRLLLVVQVKLGALMDAQAQYLDQDLGTVDDLLFGNVMAYQLIQKQQFAAAGNVLAYLESSPVLHPAVRLQILALKAQLDPSNALASAEIGIKTDEASDVGRLASIMLLIQGNALPEAQSSAQQWLTEAPNNVDALNVLAFIYQQTDMPQKAQALYTQALQVKPSNTPSLFFAAQSASAAADYAGATELYLTILDINPISLSAVQALMKLTFVSPQTPNFETLLAPISMATVTDDQMVAIADTLFQWREYALLDSLLQRYQAEKTWSDMLWMVWLKNSYSLSGVKNGINNADNNVVTQFRENYARFRTKNTLPEHAMFALSILEQNSQFDLVLEIIETLDPTTRQTDVVQLAKASALIALKQDQAAEKILRLLGDNQALSGAQWYVWGRLMEYRNDLAQAASYYTAYHQSSPGFSSVTSLANVLLNTQRTDELAVLAEKYITRHPADNSARVSLAFKLAATHLDIAVQLLSTDHVHWLAMQSWKLSNNLAALYLMQGDTTRALTYSTNAITLNPNHDGVKQLHSKIQNVLEASASAT